MPVELDQLLEPYAVEVAEEVELVLRLLLAGLRADLLDKRLGVDLSWIYNGTERTARGIRSCSSSLSRQTAGPATGRARTAALETRRSVAPDATYQGTRAAPPWESIGTRFSFSLPAISILPLTRPKRPAVDPASYTQSYIQSEVLHSFAGQAPCRRHPGAPTGLLVLRGVVIAGAAGHGHPERAASSAGSDSVSQDRVVLSSHEDDTSSAVRRMRRA